MSEEERGERRPAGAPERMIESAILLLAQHGFEAASFGAVLKASQAPRGSIYHHFPGGKQQLIAAAIDVAEARAVALARGMHGRTAVEIIDGFAGAWRAVLELSDFGAGCSAVAVTVSSDDPELVERAGAVFRSWRQALAEVLLASGLNAQQAADLSMMMLAACEGAVVLCRAERSLVPLEAVTGQLKLLAATMAG
ncbi:TetR/AcrR family transcriptional regulator [Dactylosporangium sp. NPDC049742]|uniref:TetR/AcrR family transcriptional regulator n=1 Tax=Dactylosporangium sp. NPDC049742 TaxID=3154737 RepID=UPI00343E91BA